MTIKTIVYIYYLYSNKYKKLIFSILISILLNYKYKLPTIKQS